MHRLRQNVKFYCGNKQIVTHSVNDADVARLRLHRLVLVMSRSPCVKQLNCNSGYQELLNRSIRA